MSLRCVPASRVRANRYVGAVHRHLGAVEQPLFAVAVADDTGLVRGVAISAWPSAPGLADGLTAEVVRLATDGAHNACSMLYGASWRAGRALGYTRMVTYTQGEEDGRSVSAAGWRPEPVAGGGPGWGNRPGRTAIRRATTRWVVECPDRGTVGIWPELPDDVPTLDFGGVATWRYEAHETRRVV